MNSKILLLAAATVMLTAGLAGCNSAGDDARGSGLAGSFSPDNFRRSDNTNGTQLRPDVNRAYTQPVMPTIANRGF